MQDFSRWALDASQHANGDSKQDYYLGVIMGIRDAKSHTKTSLDELDPLFHKGYIDSRVLINKVLQLGKAPEGSFEEILALPQSTPVRPPNS